MSLARVAPGRKEYDVRTSECGKCKDVQTPTVETDPMKSATAGYQHGELSHQSSSEVTLKPRKHAAWTDKENQRLKALATSGASVVRAAAALGRTIISVRDQARRLETPFPSLRIARQRWTDATRIKWN
jgi:hypothetical protein